jgi:hypothetical protein
MMMMMKTKTIKKLNLNMYEKEQLRKTEISIKTIRSKSSFVVTTKKKWPKGVLINSLNDQKKNF